MIAPGAVPTDLDVDRRRRAIVRAAVAAVRREAPLNVIDPRGIIFDRAPSGLTTLRVRGGGASHVLVPAGEGAWSGGPWRVLPLRDDEALPGARLTEDGHAGLAVLTGLRGRLRVSTLTHRLGRRAVLRVSEEATGRCRFVKLLSRKAFRRATRAYAALDRDIRSFVAAPVLPDSEACALVFDDVGGTSVHDALWAGEGPDPAAIVRGMRAFAACEPPADLPRRDLARERAAALKSLALAGEHLRTLGTLEEAVRATEPGEPDGTDLLHGDLHDKQLFTGDCGLRLIDAEGVARGPAAIDLVNLAEHLRLRGAQGCARGPEVAARLESEAGLDAGSPVVRVLRGLTRARLAGVYGRRPWWWRLAGTLAAAAAAALEEA